MNNSRYFYAAGVTQQVSNQQRSTGFCRRRTELQMIKADNGSSRILFTLTQASQYSEPMEVAAARKHNDMY
jgi:hypothetical protein